MGVAGTGGAAGVGGPAGVGDPGAGGARPADGLCPSRSGRRPDQLALLGQDGGDIVLVRDDGSIQRLEGPGAHNRVVQGHGWIEAYDAASTTTWKARLWDAAGQLRAEASGDNPPGRPGKSTSIHWAGLFRDGIASFDFLDTKRGPPRTYKGRGEGRPLRGRGRGVGSDKAHERRWG